ncbi:MAG: allantoicase [Candidatus Competibacterales bacterium]|nr:allantoicase [Candidatus Competibacterales bacterium]
MTTDSHKFASWINLAQPRLGAEVVSASDEFFAPRERLIQPQEPVFIPDRYDEHGKWMDGWESRRRRGGGHDHCIVKLGFPGSIVGFDVDTRHFTGNFPPEIAIDGALTEDLPAERDWNRIVPRRAIAGDQHNFVEMAGTYTCNYLRLNIYPDGGVARLRVYGPAAPNWSAVDPQAEIDLAAIENGGRALDCNDRHYGDPANLIAPGRPANMGDGWETRRRRTPGHDWAILALGHPGIVRRLEIGTVFFKGNYPDRCSVEGALASRDSDELLWQPLLPEQKLGPDAIHEFGEEIVSHDPINRIRLNIFPDGGISRVRVHGRIARP